MKKYIEKLLNIDLVFSGISLIILVLITFFGAILRYFFNSPIIWQEEIQLGLIVWVVFLGGSAVFRKGNHISIDMIVDLLPKKLQKISEVFAYIIGILVLIFFLLNSIKLVEQMINRGRVTDILKIPLSHIYIAIPMGCVLMIINYSIKIYDKFFIDKDN